jgi:hypothetical protein
MLLEKFLKNKYKNLKIINLEEREFWLHLKISIIRFKKLKLVLLSFSF